MVQLIGIWFCLGFAVVITPCASDEYFHLESTRKTYKTSSERLSVFEPMEISFWLFLHRHFTAVCRQDLVSFPIEKYTELTPKYPVSEKREFHHNKKGKYLNLKWFHSGAMLKRIEKNKNDQMRHATNKYRVYWIASNNKNFSNFSLRKKREEKKAIMNVEVDDRASPTGE